MHVSGFKLSLNPTANLEPRSLGLVGSFDKEFLKGATNQEFLRVG